MSWIGRRRSAGIVHDLLFRPNTFEDTASEAWREVFLTVRTGLFRDLVVQLMALIDDHYRHSNSIRKVIEKVRRLDVRDALRELYVAAGVFQAPADAEAWVKPHSAEENRALEVDRRSKFEASCDEILMAADTLLQPESVTLLKDFRNQALAHHTVYMNPVVREFEVADLDRPLKWGVPFQLAEETETVIDQLYRITHGDGTYPFAEYQRDIEASAKAFFESLPGQSS